MSGNPEENVKVKAAPTVPLVPEEETKKFVVWPVDTSGFAYSSS